ncbi:MAG: FAD-dependent oxidoreductase [Rhizomicrobium sp.]
MNIYRPRPEAFGTGRPQESETILIAGASIAGLAAALVLADGRRRILLLERDSSPPAILPHQSFERWQRRGVAQFRHSHVFLGRLTALLRAEHPLLLQELLAAGARVFGFRDTLPPDLRQRYVAKPGDEDLALLYCRRATVEFVMRRHVERLPGVRILDGAKVHGILTRRGQDFLIAQGLAVTCDGREQELGGGILIDASGRGTHFPHWLRQRGVTVGEEKSPAGILYFTRHYCLHDGWDEPAFDGSPTAGDLGYLKYGVCPADNRHFSITLALPEVEEELRRAIADPATFDLVGMALPGSARWIERAQGVSPVYAMAGLMSCWRSYLKDGRPQVLNFFAIGDAAIRSNPLYGCGCSAGILHASILSAVLEETDNPARRAIALERRTQDQFRAHYEAMARQDRQAVRRAESGKSGNQTPGYKARLRKSLMDEGLVPALRGDLGVVRAQARAFHMIDPPVAWRKHPGLFARVLWMWAKPRRFKRAARLYPAPLGPEREKMIARLGLG